MRSELRRSLLSWPFWLSVFLCAAIYISPFWDMMGDFVTRTSNLDYFYLFGVSHDLTFLWHVAPFLSCIPFAASFADERVCGMHRMLIVRQGKKKYFAKRMFSVWFSGYSVIALGMMLSMGIWIILGRKPIAEGYDMSITYIANYHWSYVLGEGHFIRTMLVACLYNGLYGGLWALMGLAVTAYIPNRYVAVVAPFLVYFFTFLICTFISQPYNEWHPLRSISAMFLGYTLPGGWAWLAVALYYLVGYGLMAGLFWLGIKKGDRHGNIE